MKVETSEIMVSVLCTAYNHEKYIDKCISSIVSQMTDFNFEILINDDHSNDKTASIVKRYEETYPDKIFAVYQKQNQYSQGVRIVDDILLPRARGKYIALCEGDDYWCENRKLQIQYDYMEQHSECSLLVHNTVKHDLRGKDKDKLFNQWTTIHVMDDQEIFMDWSVHTSSYFLRKEHVKMPDFARNFWSGDYSRITLASCIGTVVSLPIVMSVYNYGVTEGITMGNLRSSFEKGEKRLRDRINYLSSLDKYTNGIKHNIIKSKNLVKDKIKCYLLRYYNHK